MNTFEGATNEAAQLKLVLGHRIGTVKDLALSLVSVVDEIGEVPVLNFNDGINLHHEVLRYEIELIQKALRLTGNHQIRAAKMLSLKPTTLNSKIKRYNIQV